jgi:hypothetical protein
MPFHEPPRPRFALDPADESSWRPALGQFHRAGDWEQLFERELAGAPWREVLVRWWPRLLPGLLSMLTHGLIRTAHAVRSVAAAPAPSRAQLTELARGLAYWAARYAPLPGPAPLTGNLRVGEALAVLPRDPLPVPPSRPAIAKRLQEVGTRPGYHGTLGKLAGRDPQWLLSEMTAEFAGIYLAHPEVHPVPLIHGVTAPAAVRLVLPYLPLELHLPTMAAMWRTHLALVLTFTGGRDNEHLAMSLAVESEAPSLEELAARAVEHQDEHVIKFTEACLRENLLRPDPRFAAAVHAAHQRIEPR